MRETQVPINLPSFEFTPTGTKSKFRFDVASQKLYLTDDTGGVTYVTAVALRDKCSCSKCRDPSSSQKTFRISEISTDLNIINVVPDAEGLRILFGNDIPRLADSDGEHVVRISWPQLAHLWDNGGRQTKTLTDSFQRPMDPRSLRLRTGVVHWDRQVIADKVQSIDYEDYIKGGTAMWDAIVDLSRFGLVFLRNVPQDPDAIKRITTTIAPIQPTFYGETFDVRAKPNAENVAYTSDYLGLHQDLLYLYDPPQIQILHCLENSCTGGESLFCDADRVGRLLYGFRQQSEAVYALAKCVISYGYDANGYLYQQDRKTLGGQSGGYVRMWWSPPFESPHGPMLVSQAYIRGAKLLETLLNEPEAVYERKMEPGECVLFDNRRVMHGRNAFDAQGGGSRWLRGAYISLQDFYSKTSQIPEGYAEKSRGNAPTPIDIYALQNSLNDTTWYKHVKDLVETDQAEADARAEDARASFLRAKGTRYQRQDAHKSKSYVAW